MLSEVLLRDLIFLGEHHQREQRHAAEGTCHFTVVAPHSEFHFACVRRVAQSLRLALEQSDDERTDFWLHELDKVDASVAPAQHSQRPVPKFVPLKRATRVHRRPLTRDHIQILLQGLAVHAGVPWLEKHQQALQQREVLVAHDEGLGEVFGMVSLGRLSSREDNFDDLDVLDLRFLFRSPEAIGVVHGFGQQMLDQAERIAQERGIPFLQVKPHPRARDWRQALFSHGFHVAHTLYLCSDYRKEKHDHVQCACGIQHSAKEDGIKMARIETLRREV